MKNYSVLARPDVRYNPCRECHWARPSVRQRCTLWGDWGGRKVWRGRDYRRILIYLSVDLSVDKFHYTMEELDDDISFEHLLSFTMFSDCDIAAGEFCAPPIFDLPPPPRPPWLGDVIPCSDSTCPNDPVVHSITRNSDEQWSGMFHNVITVVVAFISIVISLLVLVAFIIR